jgi:hypothetical protein
MPRLDPGHQNIVMVSSKLSTKMLFNICRMCGTYVNAADFSDGLIHEVVFDVNIPVNNLLAFQLFDKWLKEWGELALQLYFAHTKQSLVVAYCSPYEVLEQKTVLTDRCRRQSHVSW